MGLIMSANLLQSERLSFQDALADSDCSQIIDWMESFLAAPHAELGRTGDVCPFVRQALSKDSIEFFINTSEDVASLEEEMKQHFLDFDAGDRSNIYRARVILPTRLANAAEAVDTVQHQLKPLFVERHLMIGQFFEACNEPGLWNKDFRPLRTPVPLLAIRSMVPTDVAFLHHDTSWLETYLDKFGNRGILALKQFEATKEARK